MNEKTRKALEMAKEFIGGLDLKISKGLEACMVIDEIDEALAQPTQEPVAWNEEEFNAIAYAYRTCPAHEIKMVSDRYQELVNYVLSITRPAPAKQWVGLSDDEIWKFWWSRPEVPEGEDDSMEAEFVAAVRRVLAFHNIKDKNT